MDFRFCGRRRVFFSNAYVTQMGRKVTFQPVGSTGGGVYDCFVATGFDD